MLQQQAGISILPLLIISNLDTVVVTKRAGKNWIFSISWPSFIDTTMPSKFIFKN